MSLHAFDDIDDALDATRAFLLPLDRGRWLRLALVVLFLGGTGFNIPFGGFNAPSGDPGTAPPADTPEITNAVILAIAAVVAVVLLLGLAYMFVGSVMEFVFVRSLAAESVSLREYARENLRRGARLFGFRIGLAVLGLVVFGLMAAIALLPLLLGDAVAITVLAVLVLAPVFLIGALVFGVVNAFTTAFVVPIMLAEERGVLAAWRRLWPTVREHWKEYGVYAVVSWAFAIGLGIAVGVAMGVVAIVLLIPALLLGLLSFGLLTVVPPIGFVAIAATIAVYLLALFVAYALAQVPVQTYLRYYALLVLGDTNEAFDIIADRRAEIRADEA